MKALSPIAVLISALLLQGCVAAAVVGTAAVGTKAATDPRSVGTQVDDGTLEVRVNSALSKDEQIKKEARINVTAYQGKVLLVGQSPNAELSARAKQIAMGVDGANEVYNEIRQGQPIGLVQLLHRNVHSDMQIIQLVAVDIRQCLYFLQAFNALHRSKGHVESLVAGILSGSFRFRHFLKLPQSDVYQELLHVNSRFQGNQIR